MDKAKINDLIEIVTDGRKLNKLRILAIESL